MPRNSSGTMSGTNGPYTAGTTISSAAINARFADDEAETTDSLSRSGKGGMLAVLRGVDGSVAAPAYSFTGEWGTGVYRAASGDLRVALGGVDVAVFNGTNTQIMGAAPILLATAANSLASVQGNRTATDPGADVRLTSTAVRTAGFLTQVQNAGFARLNVDYQGLLQLANQAAALQPASVWTAITPGANWTAGNGLGYWKDATGTVRVKGTATWGTGATNPMATLPVGFRPGSPRYFAINNETTGVPVSGFVDTNGNISMPLFPTNGQVVSFDGIAFLAEA